MTDETLNCPVCDTPMARRMKWSRQFHCVNCCAWGHRDFFSALNDRLNTRPETEAREPVACYWMCTKFDTTRHDYKFSWRLVDTHEKARELADQGYELDEIPPLITPPDDEVRGILDEICDLFNIGKLARTRSTILANVKNSIRRSNCLWRIEHLPQFSEMIEDEETGEMVQESLLNWGQTPDEYEKRVAEILKSHDAEARRFPKATEDEQALGWTYDLGMMQAAANAATDAGWHAYPETVQDILIAIETYLAQTDAEGE